MSQKSLNTRHSLFERQKILLFFRLAVWYSSSLPWALWWWVRSDVDSGSTKERSYIQRQDIFQRWYDMTRCLLKSYLPWHGTVYFVSRRLLSTSSFNQNTLLIINNRYQVLFIPIPSPSQQKSNVIKCFLWKSLLGWPRIWRRVFCICKNALHVCLQRNMCKIDLDFIYCYPLICTLSQPKELHTQNLQIEPELEADWTSKNWR